MLRAKRRYAFEAPLERIHALAGHCEHEVYADVFKSMFSCKGVGRKKSIIVMRAPQEQQLLPVSALKAYAQPVDSISLQELKLLRGY